MNRRSPKKAALQDMTAKERKYLPLDRLIKENGELFGAIRFNEQFRSLNGIKC